MSSKKSTVRKIISGFFAFLISVFLFLVICLLVCQNTVFNYEYLMRSMEKSGYYEQLSEEIEEQFISYGAASGFDQEVFDGIVDSQMVKNDVDSIIKAMYQNADEKLNTTAFQNHLYNTFIAYANQKEIQITSEIDQSIRYLVDTCVNTYVKDISVPFADQIGNLIVKFQKPIMIITYALSIAVIIFTLVIFLINHWKHRAVRNYIYALSGTFLMIAAIPIYFFIWGKIDQIGIFSPALYHFVVLYITNIFLLLVGFAIGVLIILLLLILLYVMMRQAVQ